MLLTLALLLLLLLLLAPVLLSPVLLAPVLLALLALLTLLVLLTLVLVPAAGMSRLRLSQATVAPKRRFRFLTSMLISGSLRAVALFR